VLNGVVVAVLTWIALHVLGVDYALPLAAVAFVGDLLPYIGPVFAAVPAVGVVLTHSTTLALAVAVLYVAIQQIEGHVLTPVIMQSQTHISAALVIVALTMGYSVGGILGAVTAIPVFAAGRVVIAHILAPAVRRRTGAGSRESRPARSAIR
jgi:predicted PurR-regulated permease PerM